LSVKPVFSVGLFVKFSNQYNTTAAAALHDSQAARLADTVVFPHTCCKLSCISTVVVIDSFLTVRLNAAKHCGSEVIPICDADSATEGCSGVL